MWALCAKESADALAADAGRLCADDGMLPVLLCSSKQIEGVAQLWRVGMQMNIKQARHETECRCNQIYTENKENAGDVGYLMMKE